MNPKRSASKPPTEAVFHPLPERLANLDRRYVMKEGKTLRAIVQDVPTLAEAQAVMERLTAEEVEAAVA